MSNRISDAAMGVLTGVCLSGALLVLWILFLYPHMGGPTTTAPATDAHALATGIQFTVAGGVAIWLIWRLVDRRGRSPRTADKNV